MFLDSFFFFFFLVFFSFLGTPVAYVDSQARGLIGAVAASLCQSHSNPGSEPRLRPTAQSTVDSLTTEPRWELQLLHFFKNGILPECEHDLLGQDLLQQFAFHYGAVFCPIDL